MITLYQFPPGFGLPVSVSPYCAKLELYFRLTGREYEAVQGDPRKSPNKALPFVKWPDGTIQADSREIIDELEAQGPPLDEGLSAEDAAKGRKLEDDAQRDLYFACLYSRFVDPTGWSHQKPTVKELVPWILSPIIVPIIRSSQVKRCAENDYTSDDDYDKAIGVARRTAEAIGDKPFLLGDELRTADCGVWANVMQNVYTKFDNPIRRAVRENPTLMGYVARVAETAKLSLPSV